MIDFYFYANLVCSDAFKLVEKIKIHENLPPVAKVDLVDTVKESSPECNWDAND